MSARGRGAAHGVGRKDLGRLIALLLCCLGVGLPSCSGQPPEIVRVFWQINLVEDKEGGQVYESLSLFIHPRDPDGFEDIDEVYLISDAQELFWRMDSATWKRSGSGEETWIGGNGLRLPDGRAFPSGEYRILLRDIGGDTAEQTVAIQAPTLDQARGYLPEVTVQGGSLLIAGGAETYQLWLYDAAGAYVASRSVSRGSTAIASLLAAQPALGAGFSFKVYAYVQSRNLGVITGPYFVSP